MLDERKAIKAAKNPNDQSMNENRMYSTPLALKGDGNLVNYMVPLMKLINLNQTEYKARQIDMMNPFITFHNQRMTKTRFLARPLLENHEEIQKVAEF